MASVVDIANQALQLVGAKQIISLADPSEEARSVNAAWPFVRREVLRAHSWNAATTRAILAASTTDPAWGFESAYPLPADCLRVLEVDVDARIPWRVEGREIVIDDTGPLNIRYVMDLTDSEQFDGELTTVMVTRLAVAIVERLKRSNTQRAELSSEYRSLIQQAKSDDGREQSSAEFVEDTWLIARR